MRRIFSNLRGGQMTHLHPALPLLRLLAIQQVSRLVLFHRLPQRHNCERHKDEAQHIPAVALCNTQ